jgi:hypothetical protein
LAQAIQAKAQELRLAREAFASLQMEQRRLAREVADTLNSLDVSRATAARVPLQLRALV